MSKQAVVILASGFEEIEAITPIDVLRRAGVEVTVAGLDGKTIEGAHGIAVEVDVQLCDYEGTPDALVLPGGLPGSKHLGASEEVKELALRVDQAGGICAAICAAPAYTLAQWGLLDGKEATCYPSCEEMFPSSVIATQNRVQVDGNIVTSRGAGTALEFAITLAQMLTNEETAASLRQGMLVK
jgi:4-methyl-5(b-hydroxyethyl)-thiazole monophosphate biosynthesis